MEGLDNTVRWFQSLYTYRNFISGSVKRDFQARFSQSMLGGIWLILQPLAMITVYTVIFANVMRAKLPGIDDSIKYSVYLCAGNFAWALFLEIVNRSTNVFIENGNLLKKLAFPRICLPVIVVFVAIINYLIVYALFCAFLLLTGNFPGVIILWTIPLTLVLVFFSISLGVILGVLNVFFRDVGPFVGIVLQFWFWFTPVVYPLSILPEEIAKLIRFNPLSAVVKGFQDVIVWGASPDWYALMPVTALSVFLALLAVLLFRKRAPEMVDEL